MDQVVPTSRLSERVWCTKSQSSPLNIYFHLNGFQSSLLLIHFRYYPNTCSHCEVWHRTYLMFALVFQVSIDHKTRQTIEEVMEEPDQTVYDHAQRHVYYVMYQDCYPRFLVSNVFKALLMSSNCWRVSTQPLHLLLQYVNRPFYSCSWKRGWSCPCFETTPLAFLHKSCCSYLC